MPRFRRVPAAVAALLVAFVAFAYRFGALGGTLGGFDNDHFAHLVRAEHVLDGELPLRDFADAELRAIWPPLTYETSAVAQVALGESLRSEAILTVGLLALGAAVMLWAAADVAQATFPAALIALAAVALGPKLYNYPKILAYAVSVVLILSYARQPTIRRLLPLAILTAVATLYRHDHGVFLFASCGVLVWLARPARTAKSIGIFSLAVTVALLPGIVFVHRTVGLLEYMGSCLELSRQEAARTTAEVARPSIDWTQPLLARPDPPASNPPDDSFWTVLQRRVPFLTWRVAPGILREANAAPWLYFVAWSVVLASLACVFVPSLTHSFVSAGVPRAAVGAIGVMGLLMLVVYLRNPIPARLPDVSVPVGVLGAWLMAAVPRAVRSWDWPRRVAVNGVLTIIVLATLLSVGSAGAVGQELNGFGFSEGIERATTRWREIWASLGTLPDSAQEDGSAFGQAIGYIRRCTGPEDRLLVGDNAPELNYFSGRRFAAGQLTFFSNFYTAEEDQRLAIRRWQEQSVPLALIQPEGRFEEEFGADYPLLAAYLQLEYQRAGSLDVGGRVFDVWVQSRRTSDVDGATGLPCFTSALQN